MYHHPGSFSHKLCVHVLCTVCVVHSIKILLVGVLGCLLICVIF